MIPRLRDGRQRNTMRFAARTITWGGLFISMSIWAVVYVQLTKVKVGDDTVKAYNESFCVIDSLGRIASDSLLIRARDGAMRGVFPGWLEAAAWLETIRAYGLQRHLCISYRIDSLGVIPGGDPTIRSFPVHFHIEKENRFDAVMQFVQTLCSDTTRSLRLNRLEFFGGGRGLSDVHIDVTGWIRL
jgi:hypothetical protein